MFNPNRNDNTVVRPAPTPKRIRLTVEEIAKIDRTVIALRPRPLTQWEKDRDTAIRRCS